MTEVHTGDGAAGLVGAAPFDRSIATASTDHIPAAWISQLAPDGVIVGDLRGSLDGCLLRLTMTERDVVEGAFVNLPGVADVLVRETVADLLPQARRDAGGRELRLAWRTGIAPFR